MTQIAAQAVIVLAGLWLIGVSALMALAPGKALHYLSLAGSTVFINVAEHVLRGAVGAAMMVAASTSKAPLVFLFAGGFILFSSVIILIIPRRWHHAYALWWAQRLPPVAVRILSPVSVIAGAALIWAVL